MLTTKGQYLGLKSVPVIRVRRACLVPALNFFLNCFHPFSYQFGVIASDPALAGERGNLTP